MRMAAKKRMMQRIERLELHPLENEDMERFVIHVPEGAMFISAQHDATILVMMVQGWVESGTRYKKERKETRVVMRVKDGMSIEYLGMHYIGSSNGWHLFEVTGCKGKEKDDHNGNE